MPVTDAEMLAVVEKTKKTEGGKTSVDLEIGDFVKIIDGPFKDTEGKIIEIDQITGLVKVAVSMFGRDTEVELDFSQLKAI